MALTNGRDLPPPAQVRPEPGSAASVGASAPARRRVLDRLGRVTTSGRFIPQIDGLRFVAISSVLLFHLAVDLTFKNPAAFSPTPASGLGLVALAGAHGVELFFVISGLVLALPFAEHHLRAGRQVDLRAYFLRRVTRLEPPYLLSLFLVFALLVVVKHESAARLGPHLLASMFYLHNLTYGTDSVVNNVAWSLEVEIQFYLVVPLLTALFRIRGLLLRRAVILAAIASSLVLAETVAAHDPRASRSILHYLHFFLLGFLVADFYLCGWSEPSGRRSGAIWDAAGILACLVMPFILVRPDHGPAWRLHAADRWVTAVVFPLCAFVLTASAFRGNVLSRLFAVRWITAFGGMCYTIYLLHNPILSTVLPLTARIAPFGHFDADLAVQAALVLPFVLLPCIVFFLLVEKPCMRRDWPQRAVARIRIR